MIDLKVVNSVLTQMEEERGIPKEKIMEAIELALASAYKKEYGKKGQIIRAKFDINTGKTEMLQVKMVVDESTVIMDELEYEELRAGKRENQTEKIEGAEIADDEKELYDPEKHILLSDGKRIKKGVELGDEMIFAI